jgi:hypothetical protein
MDITSVGSDLRQALRSLRRNPGLTLVVLAVVALGIGANTATLSIVHTVLARPLSYENPERLAVVWEKRQAPGGNLGTGTSTPSGRRATRSSNGSARQRSESHGPG